jgi:ABC-2 type transport system ATP-binding protein
VAEALVHVGGFRMDFGAATVVRDLSFDVHAGETFGFLGSNGSGKTTTLRALLGIYRPTAGVLHVGGTEFSPESGVRLGYLPEERGLYKREPVLEVMTYFGRLKGMDRAAARSWSRDYLERVGLADKAAVRVDRLSSGQQQKVQLGVTIMRSPELLVLDEPTQGFDPVNRRLLLDLIAEQRRAGTTVVMVTHQMAEVEQMCDRIVLLKDGVAAAYGTVAEVQERYGSPVLRVRYVGSLPPSSLYAIAPGQRGPGGQGALNGHGGQGARGVEHVADLRLRDGVDPAAVVRALVESGVGVHAATPVRTSLEDIFLRVYGGAGEGT